MEEDEIYWADDECPFAVMADDLDYLDGQLEDDWQE